VGQGEENNVEPVEIGRAGRRVDEAWVGGGERRGVGADRLALVAAGCRHYHLELGMRGAQPQQFGACVSRRADDTDLHTPASPWPGVFAWVAARILQLYAKY
jgi:hypothetical protein